MKKSASKIYTAVIFAFLFAPIAVLIFFSYNQARSLSVFSGFSLKWYAELFNDNETLKAVSNTLTLALCASVSSVIMGTAAAVGINKLRNKYYKATLNTLTDIPMTNPDIITGISLMLMFVFVGTLMGKSSSLSFGTMLIAHITFCLPYVILQVLPKLQQMDKSIPEAAMDLGCTPFRAFIKAELPEIMPGITTGFIMAFTLSLDDFVISYFTQGNGFQTLPIRIYNMTKKTVTPKMYALATIIFFVILSLLLVSNIIGNNEDKQLRKTRRKGDKAERDSYEVSGPLKLAIPLLAIALVAGVTIYSISREKPRVLNVYNWGEYISDGSEGTLDTIDSFEKWYEDAYGAPVKVNYDTFASNEDMYNKLVSGAVSYDVVIPSDYMIARMKDEEMLLPLNFDNIQNIDYISEDFKGLFYDPDDIYTVPYAYGVVGIIYDANRVAPGDADGWDLLWNEKYAGEILQYNNPRDAFGTALYKLGYSVNTYDREAWKQAQELLLEQRPLVKSYVMDEIYNMMESGEAIASSYYAGDYFTMADAQADDVDLQFYYPDPTNYYIDAMCVPSCCQDKELAEIFINYMLSEEPAIANAEYTYYASPNRIVYENEDYIDEMGEDVMEILYNGYDDFKSAYNTYAYQNLSPEMLSYINELWENLKIS